MSIISTIAGIISKGTSGNSIIKDVFDGIDKISTTDAEKEELKQKALAMYMDDRKSARAMYMSDNKLQKIFALTFLVAYIVLTALLVWGLWVYVKNGVLDAPEWVVGFVSSLWGGLSAKLNTIVDFLFGSSQGSQDKNIINQDLLTNIKKKQNG